MAPVTWLGVEKRGRAATLAFASLVFVAALGTTGPAAQAQGARYYDMQLFLPPAAGGSTFTIARPSVPRHLNAVFGIAGNYALDPFVRSETVSGGAVLFPAAPVIRHYAQLEAMAALDSGIWRVRVLGEIWFAIDVGSLNLAQAVIQRYLWPFLWEPVITSVLLLPGWAVFGAPGLVLAWTGRTRRRRRARSDFS